MNPSTFAHRILRKVPSLAPILAAFLFIAAQPRVPQSTDAPGGPGQKATWTNGNKQGVGSSATLESKVWFTLGDGVLTEAYYPAVDRAQLRLLEFVVADDGGFFERESTGTSHDVEVVSRDVLAFRQRNRSAAGRYVLTKTIFTDPTRDAIVVRVRFEPRDAGLRLYTF